MGESPGSKRHGGGVVAARAAAAVSITAFFAMAGTAAALVVRHRFRRRPRLLASTVGELRRDAEALEGSGR